MKKVCIIGLGYVGLPLLTGVAKSGKYQAFGYDISEENVEKIRRRECPITDEECEKDLKEIDFEVSSDEKILEDKDIFVICVPTPVLDDYTPDYGPIITASELVARYLKEGSLVLIESTVNPGTCDEIVLPKLEASGVKDFVLAHCPERINPGDPKWNLRNIPRNVGARPSEKVSIATDFYRSIIDAEINEVSSLKVAEATKIVENAFRDINIAYVNELARSFDAMGIDLIETLHGAANKPFAFMPHWPGRGVGGHCIAVDPYYLISRAAKSGFNHKFLKMAREVNDSMPKYTVGRLQEALNDKAKPVKGTKVLLLGLSYKENVADLRQSPCLEVKSILEKRGADLNVYDPYVPEMSNVSSLEEGLKDVSAIVLCTAHKEFLKLDQDLEKYPKVEVVVDGMNKLNKQKIQDLGIMYRGIGS
jgi:UDP-N-acetyl-D-glucosamine dehydrogenase